MEAIGDIRGAERKVLGDGVTLINQIRGLVEKNPASPLEAVELLAEVRDVAYEDLNQIQHEYLILRAAQWLTENKHVSLDTKWYWNPRQTGGADEPDLRGEFNGRIVLSAEATTSKRPVGTIADHMKSTLTKLASFEGEKFYFVRTVTMERRAKTYVKNDNLAVTVVNLTIDL